MWFAVRRPLLLLRDLLLDRNRPDLGALGSVEDPERFLWAILPHAARTFSACIALLPDPAARAAAVGYLYCRALDSYEDLSLNPEESRAAMAAFAARLHDREPGPAPPLGDAMARDDRDRAHLLLVRRCHLVDRIFLSLPAEVRGIVRDLVRDMAEGMARASRAFEEQGGVLSGEEQVAEYCRAAIGHPVVFTVRLVRHHRTGRTDLPEGLRPQAMRVGEMVQLANITRDIEKDLLRGVAYDAALRPDLGRTPDGDPARKVRVRGARRRLLRMALSRAPSYRALVDALDAPGVNLARASAVLMLLFTDRFYRSCARRAGLPDWAGRATGAALFLESLPAALSRKAAGRVLARVERSFLRAASAIAGAP